MRYFVVKSYQVIFVGLGAKIYGTEDEKEISCPPELLGVAFNEGVDCILVDEKDPTNYLTLKQTEDGRYNVIGEESYNKVSKPYEFALWLGYGY